MLKLSDVLKVKDMKGHRVLYKWSSGRLIEGIILEVSSDKMYMKIKFEGVITEPSWEDIENVVSDLGVVVPKVEEEYESKFYSFYVMLSKFILNKIRG